MIILFIIIFFIYKFIIVVCFNNFRCIVKKNGKKHQFQLSAGILLFAMNNVVKESPFLVLLSNDKGSSATGVGALVFKIFEFLLYISI